MEKIIANEDAWNKPVRIGLYSQGTAATAAKNVLQQRNGRNAAVSGWKFYTRPVPVDTSPDAEVVRGLFAVYTPDAIVPGALEAHEMAEKKRVSDLEAARSERMAEAEDEGEEPEFSDEEEAESDGEATAATSQSAPRAPRGGSRPAAPESNAPSGTLASDEALAALRDKLSGQS